MKKQYDNPDNSPNNNDTWQEAKTTNKVGLLILIESKNRWGTGVKLYAIDWAKTILLPLPNNILRIK